MMTVFFCGEWSTDQGDLGSSAIVYWKDIFKRKSNEQIHNNHTSHRNQIEILRLLSMTLDFITQ